METGSLLARIDEISYFVCGWIRFDYDLSLYAESIFYVPGDCGFVTRVLINTAKLARCGMKYPRVSVHVQLETKILAQLTF